MAQAKILVVDDDKSIVKIVRGYLEQAGYEVLSAYDGQTAIQVVRAEKPDLLVLDLMLPDKDGWEVTRLIRGDGRFATIPIIMLTARIEETDRIIGLELGADDYITKPFSGREVVARVRALLRRIQFERHETATVLQIGNLQLDISRRELQVAGEPVDLTPIEFNLLETLMKNPTFTFTREELLKKGMGYAYEGMGRTLDTHIRNLRKKIEPDPNHPIYLQTVYGVGYRLQTG